MNQPHDSNCIFCKIVGREAPAVIITEDEHCIAFMDVFPSSEGHALVVPKSHYPDVFSLPVEELQAAAAMAQRIAQAQMRALQPDGIVVTQFNGAAAGQTVFHYHIHIVPRWQGQQREIHGRTMAEVSTLKAIAAKIADAL